MNEIDVPVQGLAGSGGDFAGRLAGIPGAERSAGGPGSQAGHPAAPPHRHSLPHVPLFFSLLAVPAGLTLVPLYSSKAASILVQLCLTHLSIL